MRTHLARVWLAGGIAIALSGCGGAPVAPDAGLVPDQPGLDAVMDNQLRRLNGDRKWETQTWPWRSSLPRDVRFVAYDPALADRALPPDQALELYRVAWVRSDISPSGDIAPNSGSEWVAAYIEPLRVPLHLRNVAGRSDVLEGIPASPLAPGLYSLRLRTGQREVVARVGVAWAGIDHDRYAAAHCVDRYRDESPPYRRCAEQTTVLSTKGLGVHLVHPETTTSDGQRTMVVQGVIVNSSDSTRHVPQLRAELLSASGAVLATRRFRPDRDDVAAGGSVTFRTVFRAPPGPTHDVRVTMDPTAGTTAGESGSDGGG